MITIRADRCDGCGACLEVCSHGALFLIEGKAVVDEALCQECKVCISACPLEAILAVEQLPTAQPTRVPAIRPEPEVVVVERPQATVPLRARMLPVVGAALSLAGRELVPRLAYYLLDELDRRATGQRASGIARGGSPLAARRGGGRDSPG